MAKTGYCVKVRNKWWVVLLWHLRLIPRDVGLAFEYGINQYDYRRVDVNRPFILKQARRVLFANDTDAKVFVILKYDRAGRMSV